MNGINVLCRNTRAEMCAACTHRSHSPLRAAHMKLTQTLTTAISSQKTPSFRSNIAAGEPSCSNSQGRPDRCVCLDLEGHQAVDTLFYRRQQSTRERYDGIRNLRRSESVVPDQPAACSIAYGQPELTYQALTIPAVATNTLARLRQEKQQRCA